VLEAARVLASQPGGLARTVHFVAFSAEEYGLLGAYEHVARIRDRDGDVALMLSLDPVGYNPDGSRGLWVPYDARWPEPAQGIEAAGAALGGRLDITTIDADLIGGDARSDHYPFWAAGFPALHLASFPQPPTYHTIFDDIDVVDSAFHREVTALVTAFAADLAGLQPPPEDASEDCADCASEVGSASTPSGFVVVATALALAGCRRRRR
jgi:Zn-dependent M28 family amino/carboxypeptidase